MTFEIWMPFYGRIDHFKLAVQSVLDQTDPDWKLTILDDVYPDLEPGNWVNSLNDSRITYIRNEENLRPSRNYNKCANLSSSTFITIFGCDDIMLPSYVQRVKTLINQFPEASIIQPGVKVINENGDLVLPLSDRAKNWISPRIKGPTEICGERLATSLLVGNWTYFPSLVWKTSLLRKFTFRTDLDVVQDLAMLLNIVYEGGCLVVDPEIVFHYRRHSGSVSSVTGFDGSKFVQENTLFSEAATQCSELGWKSAARAARRHWLSRANALREIPQAITAGNTIGQRTLIEHVFGISK